MTNDSYISAMVTVELPHTTCTAALGHTVFSSSTGDTSKNWPTSLTKVSCNCPYKKTGRYVVHLLKVAKILVREVHGIVCALWEEGVL